jgi:hypothetical protein
VLTETDEHGNCTACTVLELRLYDSAWMRTNQEKIKNKIKKIVIIINKNLKRITTKNGGKRPLKI